MPTALIIGAQPADGWLALSGLPVDDGLVCGSRCRVLDHDEIYAAGDIARWLHPRHRELVRIEHWTNAVEQAQFAARQIVSPSADEFAPVEYVWSDQYDWKIQIAGRPERGYRRSPDRSARPQPLLRSLCRPQRSAYRNAHGELAEGGDPGPAGARGGPVTVRAARPDHQNLTGAPPTGLRNQLSGYRYRSACQKGTFYGVHDAQPVRG
jgi:NADPH-dependent 2,4-dienoyl-CoA reductase/sulfur reductase-like enzyme